MKKALYSDQFTRTPSGPEAYMFIYCIYSIKPGRVYLIFVLFGAGLIRGRGLFGGGAYLIFGLTSARGAYLGAGLNRVGRVE